LPIATTDRTPTADTTTLDGSPARPRAAPCYAGVPDRLAALLADAVALSALAFVVALAVSIVLGPAVDLDPSAESTRDVVEVDGAVAVVDALLVGALGLAYFAGSWRRSGRTPGQRLLALRVATQDGGRLSTRQAVIRWASLVAPFSLAALAGAAVPGLAAVALLLAGVWYVALLISASLDRAGRGLHDRIAGTAVGKVAAAWPALHEDAEGVR
jgi:uncharacterized RDD family membrane protein YckC